MTAETAQREPTMEEILASIRRIISEDDKPADYRGGEVLELQPAIQPPSPKTRPAPEQAIAAPVAPPPAPKFETPAEVASIDLDDDLLIQDVEPAAAPASAPTSTYVVPEPAYTPPPALSANDPLVGEPAATKTAGALSRLMGSMMIHSGVTLDDVVKEMLKPMLKEWLDANLPALVEAEVEKEIERIRRMAR
jgi:cell pole-organizing protein PopZ